MKTQLVVAALLVLLPAAGIAQQPTYSGSAGPGHAEARAAGAAAADTVPVGGYRFLGAIGGLPLGMAFLAMWDDREVPALAAGGGAALIIGSIAVGRGAGRVSPPPVLADQHPGYPDAFAAAYADRLRTRRTRAIAQGSAIGIAAGMAAFVLAR